MEFYKVANNAYSYLSGSLDTTSTSLNTTSDFTLPLDTSSGYYYITLYDPTDLSVNEIMTCIDVTDNTGSYTLSVQRAQQNTTAQSWVDGSPIGLNITADSIIELQDGINILESDIEDIQTDITGIKGKTDYITITQAVDLDTLESDTTTNNAKISFDSTASTKVGYISVTQAVDLDTIESDTVTNNAKISFDTTASTKVGYLTVTQPVDLDTLESDTVVNNAKVTNQTHTGDVIGATSLTIDPTAISGKTGVSPASGDYVLLWDATDSLLKKADVSTFLSGGGSGDVTGPSSSTDLALAIYDGTSGKLLKNSALIVDTSSNLVNGTGGLHITTAARYLAQTALSTSGAVSWNLRSAPSAKIILSGDVTGLTLSEISLNTEATLYVKQDASTPYSITFPASIKWAGGYSPDISTLDSINVFSFFSYDGTGLIGTHVSDTNQYSGLINVVDTTSDSYFFGSDATSNVHSWSTGLSVFQLGEDLSISNNKALSNTGANIMLGAYIDSTGAFKYTSTDDAQRINLNASTNQMDFYHCDSSSHVEGDGVAFKRRVAIAPNGLYLYNDSATQVFAVDVTGNIITSGLVDGRDIATDGTKLDGIESGANVNTVTPTNTISFSNKRNLPRVNALTSATTVNWSSTLYDINTLTVGHNILIAADSSGAGASAGEIREFLITSNGTNTVTLDTTSASYAFKYTEDVTGYTVNDTSGLTDAILTQFYNSKWNILAINQGI